MGVGGVAYTGRGENPDEKRGAAAADEEDPAIPRAEAVHLILRRLEDDAGVLELPSPCTGRRGENPLMGIKNTPIRGACKG